MGSSSGGLSTGSSTSYEVPLGDGEAGCDACCGSSSSGSSGSGGGWTCGSSSSSSSSSSGSGSRREDAFDCGACSVQQDVSREVTEYPATSGTIYNYIGRTCYGYGRSPSNSNSSEDPIVEGYFTWKAGYPGAIGGNWDTANGHWFWWEFRESWTTAASYVVSNQPASRQNQYVRGGFRLYRCVNGAAVDVTSDAVTASNKTLDHKVNNQWVTTNVGTYIEYEYSLGTEIVGITTDSSVSVGGYDHSVFYDLPALALPDCGEGSSSGSNGSSGSSVFNFEYAEWRCSSPNPLP